MKPYKSDSTIARILLIAGLVLMAFSANFSAASETDRPAFDDFKVTFTLSPDAILAYQSLWVRSSIQNVTSSALRLPNAMLGGPLFKLSITDAAGGTLPLSFPQGHFGRPFANESISGGDSVINYRDIANSLWDPLHGDASLLQAGRYYIRISIDQSKFTGTRAVNDTVIVIPFQVLSPDARELGARKIYIEAYRKMAIDKDAKASKELLRRLIRDYPESRLHETAYQLLFFIDGNTLSDETDGGWVATGREILRAIPDSPVTCEVALNLRRQLTTAEFDSLLVEVKSRSVSSPLLELRFQEKPK